MTIKPIREGDSLTVELNGRLDTNTASETGKNIQELMEAGKDEIHRLVLDFTSVPYVSSAGLAILLSLQKKYGRSHYMRLTGVSDEVMAILEITGFTQVLKIE